MIETDKLTKRYGSKLALDGVSLELKPGRPVALVGPNGAGKTTLMSLLCGYIRQDSGEMRILGHTPGHAALLGKVSALPQDALLDPNFTVIEQLGFFARLQGFGPKDAQHEALRVLELVDLKDSAKSKPGALSHGMAKRVAIAQSLIGTPKLVLLDEPTAGLDPANARAIRDLIASTSGDTTFMISSHNLEELERLCDTVLYLDKGKLSQSLSLSSLDAKRSVAEAHLTLSLHSEARADLQPRLSSLPGVTHVKAQASGREFILSYAPKPTGHDTYELELALFRLLAQEGISYRQVLNGKSLEDKLFS
nr:ABC transporter ATP-binding protein [Shewanella jiangmenensis]